MRIAICGFYEIAFDSSGKTGASCHHHRVCVGWSACLLRWSSVSGSGDDCMERNEADLPLSGVTVVSLEQAIAAPLASRHLADWGARVIKIERPGGGDFCRDYDHVRNGMSGRL